jgi:hypothetical protein
MDYMEREFVLEETFEVSSESAGGVMDHNEGVKEVHSGFLGGGVGGGPEFRTSVISQKYMGDDSNSRFSFQEAEVVVSSAVSATAPRPMPRPLFPTRSWESRAKCG